MANVDRMRHALLCIASDAGKECWIRGERKIFDIAMAKEVAEFGLIDTPPPVADADVDLNVEIAAQAGFEAMRDLDAPQHPTWWEGMPWNWGDQTPTMRDEWRIAARKMLAAVEKREDRIDSSIARERLAEMNERDE